MSEKFNPDSFSTFLETVKSSSVPSLQSLLSRRSLLAILNALNRQPEPMDSSSLLSAAGVPIDEFVSDLKQLESQELVSRQVSGGREFISLTDSGRKLLDPRA